MNSDTKIEYFTGLDLGQSHEFTGLAVLERTLRREIGQQSWSRGTYAIRHLERFPLGTSYPAICERVKELFAEPPLARSKLTVDQSAVGKPVFEMLEQANIKADLRPVFVSGGHSVSYSDGVWIVPKQELVSTVQVLLQTHRLKLAPTLLETPTFIQELVGFKMKVTLSAGESLAEWREGANDDLVLAVAIAAWTAERAQPPSVICLTPLVAR